MYYLIVIIKYVIGFREYSIWSCHLLRTPTTVIVVVAGMIRAPIMQRVGHMTCAMPNLKDYSTTLRVTRCSCLGFPNTQHISESTQT